MVLFACSSRVDLPRNLTNFNRKDLEKKYAEIVCCFSHESSKILSQNLLNQCSIKNAKSLCILGYYSLINPDLTVLNKTNILQMFLVMSQTREQFSLLIYKSGIISLLYKFALVLKTERAVFFNKKVPKADFLKFSKFVIHTIEEFSNSNSFPNLCADGVPAGVRRLNELSGKIKLKLVKKGVRFTLSTWDLPYHRHASLNTLGGSEDMIIVKSFAEKFTEVKNNVRGVESDLEALGFLNEDQTIDAEIGVDEVLISDFISTLSLYEYKIQDLIEESVESEQMTHYDELVTLLDFVKHMMNKLNSRFCVTMDPSYGDAQRPGLSENHTHSSAERRRQPRASQSSDRSARFSGDYVTEDYTYDPRDFEARSSEIPASQNDFTIFYPAHDPSIPPSNAAHSSDDRNNFSFDGAGTRARTSGLPSHQSSVNNFQPFQSEPFNQFMQSRSSSLERNRQQFAHASNPQRSLDAHSLKPGSSLGELNPSSGFTSEEIKQLLNCTGSSSAEIARSHVDSGLLKQASLKSSQSMRSGDINMLNGSSDAASIQHLSGASKSQSLEDSASWDPFPKSLSTESQSQSKRSVAVNTDPSDVIWRLKATAKHSGAAKGLSSSASLDQGLSEDPALPSDLDKPATSPKGETEEDLDNLNSDVSYVLDTLRRINTYLETKPPKFVASSKSFQDLQSSFYSLRTSDDSNVVSKGMASKHLSDIDDVQLLKISLQKEQALLREKMSFATPDASRAPGKDGLSGTPRDEMFGSFDENLLKRLSNAHAPKRSSGSELALVGSGSNGDFSPNVGSNEPSPKPLADYPSNYPSAHYSSSNSRQDNRIEYFGSLNSLEDCSDIDVSGTDSKGIQSSSNINSKLIFRKGIPSDNFRNRFLSRSMDHSKDFNANSELVLEPSNLKQVQKLTKLLSLDKKDASSKKGAFSRSNSDRFEEVFSDELKQDDFKQFDSLEQIDEVEAVDDDLGSGPNRRQRSKSKEDEPSAPKSTDKASVKFDNQDVNELGYPVIDLNSLENMHHDTFSEEDLMDILHNSHDTFGSDNEDALTDGYGSSDFVGAKSANEKASTTFDPSHYPQPDLDADFELADVVSVVDEGDDGYPKPPKLTPTSKQSKKVRDFDKIKRVDRVKVTYDDDKVKIAYGYEKRNKKDRKGRSKRDKQRGDQYNQTHYHDYYDDRYQDPSYSNEEDYDPLYHYEEYFPPTGAYFDANGYPVYVPHPRDMYGYDERHDRIRRSNSFPTRHQYSFDQFYPYEQEAYPFGYYNSRDRFYPPGYGGYASHMQSRHSNFANDYTGPRFQRYADRMNYDQFGPSSSREQVYRQQDAKDVGYDPRRQEKAERFDDKQASAQPSYGAKFVNKFDDNFGNGRIVEVHDTESENNKRDEGKYGKYVKIVNNDEKTLKNYLIHEASSSNSPKHSFEQGLKDKVKQTFASQSSQQQSQHSEDAAATAGQDANEPADAKLAPGNAANTELNTNLGSNVGSSLEEELVPSLDDGIISNSKIVKNVIKSGGELIFEDSMLSIGFLQSTKFNPTHYDASMVDNELSIDIIMTIQNTSQFSYLLSFDYSNFENFPINVNFVNKNFSDIELAPSDKIFHRFSAQCLGPYVGLPKLVVRADLDVKRHRLFHIYLPIAMSCFFTPSLDLSNLSEKYFSSDKFKHIMKNKVYFNTQKRVHLNHMLNIITGFGRFRLLQQAENCYYLASTFSAPFYANSRELYRFTIFAMVEATNSHYHVHVSSDSYRLANSTSMLLKYILQH